MIIFAYMAVFLQIFILLKTSIKLIDSWSHRFRAYFVTSSGQILAVIRTLDILNLLKIGPESAPTSLGWILSKSY